MKPYSFVLYLLIFSLFLTKTNGIRLEKGSYDVKQHYKQHGEENNLLKRNNSDDIKDIQCKDEQCSTLKTRISLELSNRLPHKELSKRIPYIHEDYSGPKHHRPSHH